MLGWPTEPLITVSALLVGEFVIGFSMSSFLRQAFVNSLQAEENVAIRAAHAEKQRALDELKKASAELGGRRGKAHDPRAHPASHPALPATGDRRARARSARGGTDGR